MILNTINTFLGFVGVMLLLSLIVTALVQVLQNLLRMRVNNLKVGLESLLEKLLQDEKLVNSGQVEGEGPQAEGKQNGLRARQLAQRIIENSRFIPTSHGASRALMKLGSPSCTWVKENALIEELLKLNRELELKALSEDLIRTRVPVLFERMGHYLNKRFAFNIRIITTFCALVVAGYFQVSAPLLLKRLSTDAAFRAKTATMAEQLAGEAGSLITASTNYQSVTERALMELARRHPKQASLLEQVSGAGGRREELVHELEVALASIPAGERAVAVKDYEAILDEQLRESTAVSLRQIGDMTSSLATLDIMPWAHGWAFYAGWENRIGVLTTAFLLCFGAPFWYERLRDLIKLRDALKPKLDSKEIGNKPCETDGIARGV